MITSFEQKTALEALRLLRQERSKRIFEGEALTLFLKGIVQDIFAMSDSPTDLQEALSERNLPETYDSLRQEIFKMEVSEAL